MPDGDSATLPTIAAVVGVCDEHELIARCISHLESQDVSAIVVVDNGSVDGTREILRRFEADGRIALLETRGDPRDDHDYFARGIRLAKERFKPDWILVQDADEFWVHRSGALRRGLVDVAVPCLSVQRFNACLCEALMRFPIDLTIEPDALDLFMEPCRLSRERMDEDENLRWIAAQPVDKIIAQASALVGVSAGGHAAVGSDGHSLPPQTSPDFLIVHVPFLDLPRFERKVRNAKALIESHPELFPGATAWHWKRWITLMDSSGLAAELSKQYTRSHALAIGREAVAIRSACQYFRERG